MKREVVLDNLTVNKSFVSELILTYGIVGAIQVLQSYFSDDMNFKHIPDGTLRLMIWQMTDSLNGLEEDANITFNSIDDIIRFASKTERQTLRTRCNHIIGAAACIETYVAS